MKRVKKIKVKFRIGRGLEALFGILLIVFLIYLLRNKTINNIYVINDSIFSEQEIITISGIKYYPKYREISKSKIIKNLKSNPFIKNVKVKRTLFSLTITISSNKPLWYQEYDEMIMLSNKKTVYISKQIMGLPILTNQVSSEYIDRFINKIQVIDKDIISKVSEITYDPNDLDNERFLLYMNDKNYVYLTLSRFEYLNKYNEMLPKLEGKKGILYLDSGNHFEIKR